MAAFLFSSVSLDQDWGYVPQNMCVLDDDSLVLLSVIDVIRKIRDLDKKHKVQL